jgi:hypothetical protein
MFGLGGFGVGRREIEPHPPGEELQLLEQGCCSDPQCDSARLRQRLA